MSRRSPVPPTVTVVTPWHETPELIPGYERAVKLDDRSYAQVVIVDNGSSRRTVELLRLMVARLGGKLIELRENAYFARAFNVGLAEARGDYVISLNSDVAAPDASWLAQATFDLADAGVFGGPELWVQSVAGWPLYYVSGWCLGGDREMWRKLGGFDAATYPLPYWEDNDLCYRAVKAGYRMRKFPWAVRHLGGRTADVVPGSRSGASANKRRFDERVAADRGWMDEAIAPREAR